jgi:hypothetical protein
MIMYIPICVYLFKVRCIVDSYFFWVDLKRTSHSLKFSGSDYIFNFDSGGFLNKMFVLSFVYCLFIYLFVFICF